MENKFEPPKVLLGLSLRLSFNIEKKLKNKKKGFQGKNKWRFLSFAVQRLQLSLFSLLEAESTLNNKSSKNLPSFVLNASQFELISLQYRKLIELLALVKGFYFRKSDDKVFKLYFLNQKISELESHQRNYKDFYGSLVKSTRVQKLQKQLQTLVEDVGSENAWFYNCEKKRAKSFNQILLEDLSKYTYLERTFLHYSYGVYIDLSKVIHTQVLNVDFKAHSKKKILFTVGVCTILVISILNNIRLIAGQRLSTEMKSLFSYISNVKDPKTKPLKVGTDFTINGIVLKLVSSKKVKSGHKMLTFEINTTSGKRFFSVPDFVLFR